MPPHETRRSRKAKEAKESSNRSPEKGERIGDRGDRGDDRKKDSPNKRTSDFVRSSVKEASRKKEWPEGRIDTENAFYEGREYIPAKFITDNQHIVEGTKSLEPEELNQAVREANGKLEDFTLKVNISTIRIEMKKQIQEARRRFPGRSDRRAWEKLLEPRVSAYFTYYIKGSVEVKAAPNPDYNCHSYTLTNGRAGFITSEDFLTTLRHNGYEEIMYGMLDGSRIPVSERKPQPTKDIFVIFGEEGDAIHSGIFAGFKQFEFAGKTVEFIMCEDKNAGIMTHPMQFQLLSEKIANWAIYQTDRSGGRLMTPYVESSNADASLALDMSALSLTDRPQSAYTVPHQSGSGYVADDGRYDSYPGGSVAPQSGHNAGTDGQWDNNDDLYDA